MRSPLFVYVFGNWINVSSPNPQITCCIFSVTVNGVGNLFVNWWSFARIDRRQHTYLLIACYLMAGHGSPLANHSSSFCCVSISSIWQLAIAPALPHLTSLDVWCQSRACPSKLLLPPSHSLKCWLCTLSFNTFSLVLLRICHFVKLYLTLVGAWPMHLTITLASSLSPWDVQCIVTSCTVGDTCVC